MGARKNKLVAAIAAALAMSGIGAAGALAGTDDGNLLNWASASARGLAHQCDTPGGSALNPGGRFTAIYRVQRPYDVELLGRKAADTPAQFPLKDRDLTMVRARGDQAHWADDMVSRLTDLSLLSGEMFNCNRILSMTGVRPDDAVPQENAYRLAGNSRVWAVVPDWEKLMWDFAYGRSAPYWSGDYTTNVNRVRHRVSTIDQYGKHSGVVMTGWRHRGPNAWNYGGFHKRTGIDLNIVQLQEECQISNSRLLQRISRLKRQYRMAGVPLSRLSVEVSFSNSPRSTPLPHDVVPSRAANCVRVGYAAGIKTWLLWNHPSDLDEFYGALPDYIRK